MRGLRRAEKWLEHAKKRLCTVWIKTNTGKFSSDAAFQLWTQHLDHMEHLELDFSKQQRAILDWPNAQSSLTSLNVRGVSVCSIDLFRLLSCTPRLERLFIDLHSHHGLESTELDIQSTRLTHLDLNSAQLPEAHEFLRLLRICPSLMFLRMGEGWIDLEAADNVVAVELPELKVMSLPWSSLSLHLIPLLITPSLQYLLFDRDEKMTCAEMEKDLGEGTLDEYERDLELGEPTNLGDPNLAFFLRRMPRVENLVVDAYDPFDDLSLLIGILTTPDNDGSFVLPNLRNLTMRNAGNWGAGSLSGFERRYEGIPGIHCHLPPPLRSITIEACWMTGGFDWLRRLCKKHGTEFSMRRESSRFDRKRHLVFGSGWSEWDHSRNDADTEDSYDETAAAHGADAGTEGDEKEDGCEGEGTFTMPMAEAKTGMEMEAATKVEWNNTLHDT